MVDARHVSGMGGRWALRSDRGQTLRRHIAQKTIMFTFLLILNAIVAQFVIN